MIQSHNPWGRKGGGAPNDTIRMTNITDKGLFPETFNDVRNYVVGTTPSAGVSRIFRSGGGGAPLRSESGRVITTFREDPALSFNDATRNIVDIELRYKQTPQMKKKYKLELGKYLYIYCLSSVKPKGMPEYRQ